MGSQSGSKRAAGVPDGALSGVRERLEAHVERDWPGCKAIQVRKRGGFVYVDAQAASDPEPAVSGALRTSLTGGRRSGQIQRSEPHGCWKKFSLHSQWVSRWTSSAECRSMGFRTSTWVRCPLSLAGLRREEGPACRPALSGGVERSGQVQRSEPKGFWEKCSFQSRGVNRWTSRAGWRSIRCRTSTR